MNKVEFSSHSVMWETPWDSFNNLNRKYNFDLDVCAIKENSKCRHFFSPQEDGLKQPWHGRCWMNPPYGRNETGKWVEKAFSESLGDCLVVALLPARTDTKWYQQFVNHQPSVAVRFLKGRLKFGGSRYPAPLPSMVVVFGVI